MQLCIIGAKLLVKIISSYKDFNKMVILLKKLQHLETQYIQGFRILHPCIEECQYSCFIQI